MTKSNRKKKFFFFTVNLPGSVQITSSNQSSMGCSSKISSLFCDFRSVPVHISSDRSETWDGLFCSSVLKINGVLFRVRSILVNLRGEPRSS